MDIYDIDVSVSVRGAEEVTDSTHDLITLDHNRTRYRDDALPYEFCSYDFNSDELRLASAIPSLIPPNITEDHFAKIRSTLFAGTANFNAYRNLLRKIDLLKNSSLDQGGRIPILIGRGILRPNENHLETHISHSHGDVRANYTFGDFHRGNIDRQHVTEQTIAAARRYHAVKTGDYTYHVYNAQHAHQRNGALLVNNANHLLDFAVRTYLHTQNIPGIYEDIETNELCASAEEKFFPWFIQVHSPLRCWWHLINQWQLYPELRMDEDELTTLIESNWKRVRVSGSELHRR